MSYSLRNTGARLTWNYFVKPLLHGQNPFAHPYGKLKRTMSQGGTIKSPKKMASQRSRVSSYSTRVASVEDGQQKVMKFSYKCPRIGGTRVSKLDRLVSKSNKMQHLYDTFSDDATSSIYNSQFGKSKYTTLDAITAAQLQGYVNTLHLGYPNLIATGKQDTSEKTVFLNEVSSSITLLNGQKGQVRIEVLQLVARKQIDATVGLPGDTLAVNSSALANAASGYNQSSYGVGTTDTYPKLSVDDPDYHWSMNHNFTTCYKILAAQRCTIPTGGQLRVDLRYIFKQNLSNLDLQESDVLVFTGQPCYLIRQQGLLQLGGGPSTGATVPSFNSTHMAWYQRDHVSGFGLSSAFTNTSVTSFGKANVAALPEFLHNWEDDSDQTVNMSADNVNYI